MSVKFNPKTVQEEYTLREESKKIEFYKSMCNKIFTPIKLNKIKNEIMNRAKIGKSDYRIEEELNPHIDIKNEDNTNEQFIDIFSGELFNKLNNDENDDDEKVYIEIEPTCKNFFNKKNFGLSNKCKKYDHAEFIFKW